MSGLDAVSAHGAGQLESDRAAIRRLADELEGVFLSQLFQAMRSTVPEGGLVEESSGEEMFRAMLDEQLAQAAATQWKAGIGAALYEQLTRYLTEPTTSTSDQAQSGEGLDGLAG